MKLAHLNANLLVALDLLLTEGSVARAAERQGVTPSAMSHSLRALRELFGDPLLTRTSRGMIPTPLAEQLAVPLRRALRDLERAVGQAPRFDPAESDRVFVLAAPDFVSTLLLTHLAPILAAEAPRVEIEVRPVSRRSAALVLDNAARLADGEIDLAVAALLDGVPGIRTDHLYDERFVCVVREGHPHVGATLDLETYAALEHVLVTITDERTPTWIDEALAAEGLARHVRVRTRYFTAAPLVVAESDLLLTCPYQLARFFAARLSLRILEPPLPLPRYAEQVGWHERFAADPGLTWLRGALARAAASAVREPG